MKNSLFTRLYIVRHLIKMIWHKTRLISLLIITLITVAMLYNVFNFGNVDQLSPSSQDTPYQAISDQPIADELSDSMNLPSVLSLMHKTKKSFDPIFRIKPKADRTFQFVFGIPTVKRTVKSYIISTLQSLIENLNIEQKKQTCFVVMIAETNIDFVHQIADDIVGNFEEEIKSGLIEIIAPSPSFYPDMTLLRQTLGDTMERVMWRSKQNLDYAYLMMYCQNKGAYYVALDDDIISKPTYLTQMQAFVTELAEKNQDWLILKFCSLGSIGKVFKSADLTQWVLYFVMFYSDKPMDWLLDHYLDTKLCHFDLDKKGCIQVKEQSYIQYKPSLFQHVGTHSSLKGKIQKISDKNFDSIDLSL